CCGAIPPLPKPSTAPWSPRPWTRSSRAPIAAADLVGARGWPHEGVPAGPAGPEGQVAVNDPGGARVAVYIDFDNIVISRYDQVHGRNQFQRDKAKGFDRERLQVGGVEVGGSLSFP